jgi:hypothetical protein
LVLLTVFLDFPDRAAAYQLHAASYGDYIYTCTITEQATIGPTTTITFDVPGVCSPHTQEVFIGSWTPLPLTRQCWARSELTCSTVVSIVYALSDDGQYVFACLIAVILWCVGGVLAVVGIWSAIDRLRRE